MLMDDIEITVMVEDLWRTMLSATASGNGDAATAAVNRFQKMIEEMAALMSPADAESFNEMVENAREKLFREYNADPEALRERLGVGNARGVTYEPNSSRMGLGQVAVRTAVRATVWESIYSLFRAFR